MSLLSKIFIFLVLLAAAFSAFVTATLYFARQDFRDKWIREANAHAQTAAIKDAEIGHLRNLADHQEAVIEQLHRKNSQLEGEIASTQQRLADAQQQLVIAQQELGRMTETLRVQMAQTQALLVMVEGLRDQNEQLKIERDQAREAAQNARAEVIDLGNENNTLQRELMRAEEALIELAQRYNTLEGQMEALRNQGIDVDVLAGGARAPLDGFVRGVDPETRLVVISVGEEAGVRRGDEFTIYRDGVYVAKVEIDRIDRDWAAGRYTLELYVPRVGDRASNRIMQGSASAGGAGR